MTKFTNQRYCFLSFLLWLLPGASQTQAAPNVQIFTLTDTKGLIKQEIDAEVVDFKGRKALRLMKSSPGEGGLAILPGTDDFEDGTIEADLAVKVTTPPVVRMPGFIGLAFRARSDGSHYEMFYLRPGNSLSDDQAMRNHSVQYCAAPGFDWYSLRRAWPTVYEAYAELQPETWTKVKVEVEGRTARLYLNGSTRPTLVVDGLKGEDLHGAIALWGYAREEAYFSNVRITRAAPKPEHNGGDAAGSWDVKLVGDAAMFQGSLRLVRDGNNLTGTWTGDLGNNLAVSGTWRNGYVELSFAGNWPDQMELGAAGNVRTVLAGWIDGASAGGRMKVEGRTDGKWTALRNPRQE